MPHAAPRAVSTDEEWRQILTVCQIPEGPLRTRLLLFFETLVAFAVDPGCSHIQADGFPCPSASSACDRCEKVLGILDRADRQLRGA